MRTDFRVKRVNANRPRPMIAKLHSSNDKVRTLKARPTFKEGGLGMSSDLTSRQRQQLQAVKGTNTSGYFKHGRLVTKPRTMETPSTTSSTSNTTRERRSFYRRTDGTTVSHASIS